MQTHFINRPNLERLLKTLAKTYRVYAPVKSQEDRVFKRVREDNLNEIIIGETRPVQSIKSFFFPARSKVADYFSEKISDKKERPVAIVGSKACDLASLKVMDYVFTQGNLKDPIYEEKRRDSLIISSDCTCYGESCFCVALGIDPYPVEDFDINLSEIESGYIVTVGSEKGEKLLREHAKLFQNGDLYVEKRDANRAVLKKDMKEHLKNSGIPSPESIQDLFKKKYDSDLWYKTAETCVECGACNVICPACHCFVLEDNKKEDGFERLRLWDSCLLMSYARVAGGANPRKLLSERLRNRFDKKFNFFPDAIGKFGCTGCGRCSQACPGKIRIQEVLKNLS